MININYNNLCPFCNSALEQRNNKPFCCFNCASDCIHHISYCYIDNVLDSFNIVYYFSHKIDMITVHMSVKQICFYSTILKTMFDIDIPDFNSVKNITDVVQNKIEDINIYVLFS